MKKFETIMIGQIQEGIKLQKTCGEITRGCWQKEGLMRQMRSQTRSHLTLMNGMERVRIISMMFKLWKYVSDFELDSNKYYIDFTYNKIEHRHITNT